jgi:uncharacterized protein
MKSNNKNHSADKVTPDSTKIYKIIALFVIAVLAIYFIFKYFGQTNNKPDKEYVFKKNGELTFQNPSGTDLTKIDIQIANTEFDRELGLMFRKNMNENQGMLFIFPDIQIRNFWMRNTEIPLDMIFMDSSRTILNIAQNTTPYSDNSYSSVSPAKFVLEVNGGFTKQNDIRAGDKVIWIESR